MLPIQGVKVKLLSHVRLFVTPWTVAYQAPPSMEISRQEYWSGLPFPSPGDLPDPGIEPRSPTLQADALPSEPPGKPIQGVLSLKQHYLGNIFGLWQVFISFIWLPSVSFLLFINHTNVPDNRDILIYKIFFVTHDANTCFSFIHLTNVV